MAVVSKRSRSDDPVSIDGLDEAVLRGMYRAMLLTRSVEERGHSLYRQGRIPGSFYTGRGNEAAAVGVAWAMAAQDVGCPTQRDLGVHIVRGMAPWRILAQYLGRSDGPTQGRDGNVHLGDAGLGTLTMVSHLPAMLPVAVGCALAFRVRKEPRADELRRRAPPPAGLRARRRRLRVFHARAARVRRHAPRRASGRVRLRRR